MRLVDWLLKDSYTNTPGNTYGIQSERESVACGQCNRLGRRSAKIASQIL